MTVQKSDKLENKLKTVDFGKLSVYGVCTGDININSGWGECYSFISVATPRHPGNCSGLWKGYISCYVLDKQGELSLARFEYPFENNHAPDIVNERLKDDFWLIMRDNFYGDNNYIPFVQGKIVSDRSRWKIREGGNLQSSSELIEKIFLDVNKAELIITVDPNTAGSLRGYKVYIDGFIHFTCTEKDTPPENGYLTRIQAGKRRIIVREFEVNKANRRESNTIYFEAVEDMTSRFHLVYQKGGLILLEISRQ